MIRASLIFALGFLLAMKITTNIFNPDSFKEISLSLAANSYKLGCLEADGKDCELKTLNYYKKIFWSNK